MNARLVSFCFGGGGLRRRPRSSHPAVFRRVCFTSNHQLFSDVLRGSLKESTTTPTTMSDAAAPAKQVKKATKPKKPKAPAAHPPVAQMVTAAITSLKERNGSSLAAIKKYIAANYKCDVEKTCSIHPQVPERRVLLTASWSKWKASYKVDKN